MAEGADNTEISPDKIEFESEEQKKEVVGNLVADDEWDGLTMELTDLVRKSCKFPYVTTSSTKQKNERTGDAYSRKCIWLQLFSAVVEDLKKNAREFLGKDDYKVGDM